MFLIALTLALSGAAQTRSIAVNVERDSALPCPAHAAFLAAAARRTPAVEQHALVEANDAVVVLDRESDRWRLQIRQADKLELQRELDFGPSECEALGDAAAFIVERHFADLSWRSAAVELPPSPVAPPSASHLELTGFALSAGGGAALDPRLQGLFTVEGSALFSHRYRAGLAVAGTWPRSEPVFLDELEAGQFETQSFSAAASLSVCTLPSRWVGCGGLGLGTHLLTGKALGDRLHPTGPARLWLPFAQASVRGGLMISEKWLIFADLLVAVHAGTATIAVEGAQTAIHTSAPVEPSGVVRLERRF